MFFVFFYFIKENLLKITKNFDSTLTQKIKLSAIIFKIRKVLWPPTPAHEWFRNRVKPKAFIKSQIPVKILQPKVLNLVLKSE